MRQTQFLIPTLKEDPADAEVASHRLMLRAGMIRQLASGLYSWLPLGVRVIRRIEKVIREEMNRSGAQEVLMPVVQPAELWRETKRWDKMGPEMLRLHDRHERDFCLGPTHEEVITDLFRREIQSYRQLPINFYQIQTKFRDEVRPRFGVMRAREFTMKDGYSFHLDQESFDATYAEMHNCYSRILKRLELDFRAVDADTGNIGGSNSHEFHVLTNAGEDTIVFATDGDYAANLEKAVSAPPGPRPAPTRETQKVATPDQTTIDQVAEFLDVPAHQSVKTLIVEGESEDEGSPPLVALVLRGDHDLNEIKAQKLPGVANPLTFADPDRIRREVGAGVGSIGPVGLKLRTLVDPQAAVLADFVCGANEDGFHILGVNWERDVPIATDDIYDMRNVVRGDPAPNGQGELDFLRGIEVGHIFQLGTVYSAPMDAGVLNENGRKTAPIMGCYGMGVTRLVAAVVEQYHDDQGIHWPRLVTPFDVHILGLNYSKSEAVQKNADALYEACKDLGIDALLDDRDERPGVKFADSDLIGLPVRITVGDRGLKEGNVEVKVGRGENQTVAVDQVITAVSDALAS
jgi:prolyl-tRNA synthetase